MEAATQTYSAERVEQAWQAMYDFLSQPLPEEENAFRTFCFCYLELLEACLYDEDWVTTIINDCIAKEPNSPSKEQIDFWKSQFKNQELEAPNTLSHKNREIIEWLAAAQRAQLYEAEPEVWEWLTQIVARKEQLSLDEASGLIEDYVSELTPSGSQDG